MALRLIEGFELGELESSGTAIGFTVGGINTVNVRAGSGARYLSCENFNEEYHFDVVPWDATTDTLFVGCAIRLEDVIGGNVFLSVGGFPEGQVNDASWISLSSGTDGIVHVNSHSVDLANGGTQLFQSAPGAMVTNTWHYVEIKFLCHESAGAVELWVDGVSVGSVSGTDTQAEGTAAFKPEGASLRFTSHSSSNDTEIDDVYILDTNTTSPETGTSPNITRLGDIVIEALSPTSDAVPNNFTRSAGANNWELVDEIPPDDDTTYVESSTVAHEDRYGLSNRVHTGAVVGVSVQVQAEKTSANARTLNIGLTSNAGATVDAQPASMTLINGVYATGQKTYDRDFHDEVTAADWTTAKVNLLETSTVVV